MDKSCEECGSKYKSESSKMVDLCPECSHNLYGYENCPHNILNGICTKCGWDGSESKHISKIKNSSK
ncbi:hypothetical protein NBRC116492_06210 [Aurantivibrio infirmus]